MGCPSSFQISEVSRALPAAVWPSWAPGRWGLAVQSIMPPSTAWWWSAWAQTSEHSPSSTIASRDGSSSRPTCSTFTQVASQTTLQAGSQSKLWQESAFKYSQATATFEHVCKINVLIACYLCIFFIILKHHQIHFIFGFESSTKRKPFWYTVDSKLITVKR